MELNDTKFGEFDFEFNNNNNTYVARHKSSSRIADFSSKKTTNETMRFERVNSLGFQIPAQNESLMILTSKAISLLDVLHFIETKTSPIEEAYIYLYTINQKAVKYLHTLSERSSLNLIISDLMNSKREKERVITRLLETKTSFIFVHNHAKLLTVKLKNGDYFTLTGSMNAGNNARVENLQIIGGGENV